MRGCGDNRVLVGLTILIHISYFQVAQTSWPRAVVSTDHGVEVTEDEQRFLRWNFADGNTEVLIEPYPSIMLQRLMLEHKH